jgi:RING-like zinc finger/FHA domain
MPTSCVTSNDFIWQLPFPPIPVADSVFSQVQIRDTKSSSGTFLNHIRLSAAGQLSTSHPLSDGDTIQLGVDYQGGVEEIYRAVRMKIEIDRPTQSSAYSLATFHQLKSLNTQREVDECCICLYSIAPRQALFIAPCSHHFHYKCIRPLLASHPAFQCPLCRAYADLDASVEVDLPQDIDTTTHLIDVQPQPIPITASNEPSSPECVGGATFVSEVEEQRPRETTVSPESDEEQDSMAELSRPLPPQSHITSPLSLYQRRHSSSGFVDKLKMAIFDKRRLSYVSGGKRRRSSHSDDDDERDTPATSPIDQHAPMATSPSSFSANEPSSSRMASSVSFLGA